MCISYHPIWSAVACLTQVMGMIQSTYGTEGVTLLFMSGICKCIYCCCAYRTIKCLLPSSKNSFNTTLFCCCTILKKVFVRERILHSLICAANKIAAAHYLLYLSLLSLFAKILVKKYLSLPATWLVLVNSKFIFICYFACTWCLYICLFIIYICVGKFDLFTHDWYLHIY